MAATIVDRAQQVAEMNPQLAAELALILSEVARVVPKPPEGGSTGTAVNTGDLITAAKMNLKLEDLSDSEENSAFSTLRFLTNSGGFPAGTVRYLGADNTNDVTLNVRASGQFNIAVNGTDEWNFGATSFVVPSGNRVDFDAAAGAVATFLVDVNNNELLETYGTAAAVNHIVIRNSATTVLPIISSQGTGADADIGIMFHDSNGNELLEMIATAAAVNGIRIVNNSAGNRPVIANQGGNDIGLVLANWDGANTEEILILAQTATAVNQITITNAAATGTPDIRATGDDAAVSLTLSTTGTGTIIFRSATTNRVAVNNAYSMTWYQASFNYTVTWSDPGAARTITFPDPGGNDSVTYIAASQTLTNKTLSSSAMTGTFTGAHTYSGILTLTAASMALTAGQAFTLGTTDAFELTLRANNASRLGISSTIGQLVVYQTTGNYTLSFADPGAGRTITIADPGGAATLAYINQAQTHTVAHIFTGTPIFRSTVAGTNAIEVENTTDNASVLVAILEGDRATPGDGDAAYVTLRLSDSAGNQDEQARITWAATTVADGATQDGDLFFSAVFNGALTEHIRLDGSANQTQASRPVYITVAANALQVEQTNDAASVQVAIFEGNRATPGDNDAAYISLRLSDSAGNQDEGARITWQATTVADGATQDTDMILSALVNNVLTTFVTLDGSASEVVLAQNLRSNSAGSWLLVQAGGTYTITWADPAANRAITLPDPGGADNFVFASMTQTLTGKTISLSGDLTFAAALDIEVQTNTAATLQINAGGDALLNVDSRTATDAVIVFTWDLADPTFASGAGSEFHMHRFNAFTVTLTGGTGVTAINGLALEIQAPTITSASATTITTASTVFIRPITAAGAGPASITNSRMIDTSVAGCFLTAAGTWTDASTMEVKEDINPADLSRIPGLLDTVELYNFRYRDHQGDGGKMRLGLIAEYTPDFLTAPGGKGVPAMFVATLALAGVKWMKTEVETLREELVSLRDQQIAIEARLQAIGA